MGDYNLPNVLCAAVIGKYFSVPEEKIKSAIENYAPSNSRSQLLQLGTNTFILDAYNANPTSMKAAIDNFAKLSATKKILMLGSMMELGAESIEEHKNLVKLIKQYPWHTVVLVGGDFAKIDHGFIFFPDSTEHSAGFSNRLLHKHILIKGSRSMQMEKYWNDWLPCGPTNNDTMTGDAKKKRFYLSGILTSRCPRCREGKVFLTHGAYRKNSAQMHENCPVCGQPTEIEVGFYYGTGYVSYALSIALLTASFVPGKY